MLSKSAVEKTGVAADAPIDARLKALKGLTFGVTRPGAMTDQHIRFLLSRLGLTANDASLSPSG